MYIIIAFICGFLFKSLLNYLFTISIYVKFMKDLEIRYLIMGLNFVEWKAYALQILELSYEKVSEEDPEKKESFKIFRNRVEEKYNEANELYVMQLKSFLPYKTEYTNWKGAMQYLQTIKKK